MISTNTIEAISAASLPDSETMLAKALLLRNYYELYVHHTNGTSLPEHFPKSLLDAFPTKLYRRQLKTAMINLQHTYQQLQALQNEYLSDYFTLYMHYTYHTDLPEDFPQTILDAFPTSASKDELQAAIASLQEQIRKEHTIC